MPYYHVYIEHHDPSRNGPREAYELDLSIEELTERVVNPYLNGKTFMCGGQPIDAFFIDVIKISKTAESSSALIPKLIADEERKAAETGIGSGLPDEYLVVEHGKNVTRDFITHTPIKEIAVATKEQTKVKNPLNKNVFIVHGTDHTPVEELKTIIIECGLNPIILHEQPSKGMTLVEKLEKYSNVGFAIIVLTPDDLGVDKKEVKRLLGSLIGKEDFSLDDYHKWSRTNTSAVVSLMDKILASLRERSRQNVVLEFGYFMGRLSREKICCLYKGDIELPSDMHGITYIPFKNSVKEVKDKIIKELLAADYEIKV